MNFKEYVKEVKRTEAADQTPIANRASSNTRLIHAALGLSTECGEVVDTVKRLVFYGKAIDVPNLKEEIGDLAWYIALLVEEFELDFEDILDTNINKLKRRYPQGFTEHAALNRNLMEERQVLENVKEEK